MTDFNLATGNTGPINRSGFENNQVTGEDIQATPVGVQPDGDGGYEVVAADADSGAQIQAVGVLLPEEVVDPSTIPTGNNFQDLEEQLVQEYRTLQGDRVTAIFDGVELVNDDGDTDFTPGEPVYLDVGGGFTQTAPSGTGEIVQVLGVAFTPDDGGDGNDRILLDVERDYETLA